MEVLTERSDMVYTTPELASVLRMQPSTLAAWRRSGRGPDFIVLGNRVRYRVEDVAAWLAERVRAVQQ